MLTKKGPPDLFVVCLATLKWLPFPGSHLHAKVCNKSCRWQVLCMPKYAGEAAMGRFDGGRFSV